MGYNRFELVPPQRCGRLPDSVVSPILPGMHVTHSHEMDTNHVRVGLDKQK